MASLNARVGAVALIIGGAGTVALGFAPVQLAPLQILALAISVFGVWAFADEMGHGKPLNRAGLVAFAFAAASKTVVLIGGTVSEQQYLILYLFSLMGALFLWSLALLHRDRSLKIAGALGAVSALLPILLLIAGHVFLGVGAVWGISYLYDTSLGGAVATPAIAKVVEGVFMIWSFAAAALLWTGKV